MANDMRAKRIYADHFIGHGSGLTNMVLDNIAQGNNNRYIENNTITPVNANRQLEINGDLFVSGSIITVGESISFTAQNQDTTSITLTGVTNEPSVVIKRNDNTKDFMNVSNVDNNNIFNIINTGQVGIGMYPTQNDGILLNVNGALKASHLYGDASRVSNVNFGDRTTSHLLEGSNLYYKSSLVGNITTASNLNASNYVRSTSNAIEARLTSTSNAIDGRLTSTSNAIEGRLTTTSNAIEARLSTTSNAIERRLTTTSNAIEGRLTTTSNVIMTTVNTYNYGLSNYLHDIKKNLTSDIHDLWVSYNTYIGHSNVHIYHDDVRVYYNSVNNSSPYYLYYKFFEESLTRDHSPFNRPLANYGGTYQYEDEKDALYLTNGQYSKIPDDAWGQYESIVMSFMFKINNAYSGDLLKFNMNSSLTNNVKMNVSGSVLSYQIHDISLAMTETITMNAWNTLTFSIKQNVGGYEITSKLNDNVPKTEQETSVFLTEMVIDNSNIDVTGVTTSSSAFAYVGSNVFAGTTISPTEGYWESSTVSPLKYKDDGTYNGTMKVSLSPLTSLWSIGEVTNSTETYSGETIYIPLTQSNILKAFKITVYNTITMKLPTDFRLFGANSASNAWVSLQTTVGAVYTVDGQTSFVKYDLLGNDKPYLYYLFVINKSSTTSVRIDALSLFTYPIYTNVIGSGTGNIYLSEFAITADKPVIEVDAPVEEVKKQAGTIYMLRRLITSFTTINIIDISYKISIDVGYAYYRTFDVSVIDSVQKVNIYSISLIASYDDLKVIKDVSYHVYFSHYSLDRITSVTDGISLSGNTLVFVGETLHVTPLTDCNISIISQ
jgi:hypothetical protein